LRFCHCFNHINNIGICCFFITSPIEKDIPLLVVFRVWTRRRNNERTYRRYLHPLSQQDYHHHHRNRLDLSTISASTVAATKTIIVIIEPPQIPRFCPIRWRLDAVFGIFIDCRSNQDHHHHPKKVGRIYGIGIDCSRIPTKTKNNYWTPIHQLRRVPLLPPLIYRQKQQITFPQKTSTNTTPPTLPNTPPNP
jgi:hypothetical protein